MNSPRMYEHIPNGLTCLRLALIPVFVFLMTWPGDKPYPLAGVVFAAAALTDFIDGYLARRWNVVSDFGKLFDPLADKILVMAALVLMVAQTSELTGDPWIPAWIVVLVLAREIWVTGVRGFAANKGLIIPAAQSGKWKSFLQMMAILLFFFRGVEVPYVEPTMYLPTVGMMLLYISVLLSYWGAIDYTWQALIEPGPARPTPRKSASPQPASGQVTSPRVQT